MPRHTVFDSSANQITAFALVYKWNRPRSINQYSYMDPRFSGQNCKLLKFLLSLNSQKRLDTKKTTPNIEVCPESLGAMLEYWYVERGLFY